MLRLGALQVGGLEVQQLLYISGHFCDNTEFSIS